MTPVTMYISKSKIHLGKDQGIHLEGLQSLQELLRLVSAWVYKVQLKASYIQSKWVTVTGFKLILLK